VILRAAGVKKVKCANPNTNHIPNTDPNLISNLNCRPASPHALILPFTGFEGLSYGERLRKLQLCTLKVRRLGL